VVSVAVLAGTPGAGIDRCVRRSLDAGASEVAVFSTVSAPDALPDRSLLEDSRVTLAELSWNESFAQLRNEALGALPQRWVLFVDADEWPTSPLSGPERSLEQLDAQAVYSPTITEAHSQATMTGIPRLVFSGSTNRYVRRVHEHCCRYTTGEGVDLAPLRVDVQLAHDGYNPSLYDLEAKSRRNAELGRQDLVDDPGDPRSLHFYLRDCMSWATFDQSVPLLDRLASSSTERPGYRANGRDAAWYFTKSLPLGAELALKEQRLGEASELAHRMMEQGQAAADGEYYRVGAKLLQGRADPDDLTRLMRFRQENPQTGSASLSPDGRHLDAMIVLLLTEMRGEATARRYWQECDPWTDGFFVDSWPRALA